MVIKAIYEKEVKKLDKILNDYREVPLSQEIGSRARELMKTHAKSDGLLPLDALIAATALHVAGKRKCRYFTWNFSCRLSA